MKRARKSPSRTISSPYSRETEGQRGKADPLGGKSLGTKQLPLVYKKTHQDDLANKHTNTQPFINYVFLEAKILTYEDTGCSTSSKVRMQSSNGGGGVQGPKEATKKQDKKGKRKNINISQSFTV